MPIIGYRPGGGQLPGGFYMYDPSNPPGQIEERLAHAEYLRQQAAEIQARRQAAQDALLNWQNAGDLLAPVMTPGSPATPETTQDFGPSPDALDRRGPSGATPAGLPTRELAPGAEPPTSEPPRATAIITPGKPAVAPTSRPPTSTEVAGRGARYMSPADTIKQITESMDKDSEIAARKEASRLAKVPKNANEVLVALSRGEMTPEVAQGLLSDFVTNKEAEAKAASAGAAAGAAPTLLGAGKSVV